MNALFFGTPDFVIPVAQSLLNTDNCKLSAVVTAPDRPVGRDQILKPSPVKQWAEENKTSVLTPEELDDSFQHSVLSFQPEIGILAAYGKIIPKEIIDLFPKGILVVHPSLLPKYRGASPAQAAIVCSDQETGVSIILMDEQMDHGPIVYQFRSSIKPDDTADSLYQRLFQETAQELPSIINDWVSNKIQVTPQNHDEATFTRLLKKENGFIPWEYLQKAMAGQLKVDWPVPFLKNYSLLLDSSSLERLIRALSPWPGAWTSIEIINHKSNSMNRLRLKILKAHVENNLLILDQVQLEGKKPVSWKQFLQLTHNN